MIEHPGAIWCIHPRITTGNATQLRQAGGTPMLFCNSQTRFMPGRAWLIPAKGRKQPRLFDVKIFRKSVLCCRNRVSGHAPNACPSRLTPAVDLCLSLLASRLIPVVYTSGEDAVVVPYAEEECMCRPGRVFCRENRKGPLK